MWSPDGTKIAFSRDGDGLFWVNATTTVQAGTSFGATGNKEIEPSWGRMLKAVNDTYAPATGGTLTETAATGVLANDPGLGSNDTVTAKVTKNPTHASAFTFDKSGSFTYTHDGSDFDDSFEYTVTDAGGNVSNTAVVTLDTPANAAPVAKNDTYSVESGQTLTVPAPGVLGNDTDVEDGKPGTAVKKTDPSNGTLTLNANGSFTYKHNGTGGNEDSFTYQAQDSGGKVSNVATVTLQIGGVHTVGLVDPAQGKWYLYNEAGVQQKTFFYGNPGDFPIYGDWDCDGEETPGMYRQSDGFVYLRDSNTQGLAISASSSGIPVTSRWRVTSTVMVRHGEHLPGTGAAFYIINELGKNEGGLGGRVLLLLRQPRRQAVRG